MNKQVAFRKEVPPMSGEVDYSMDVASVITGLVRFKEKFVIENGLVGQPVSDDDIVDIMVSEFQLDAIVSSLVKKELYDINLFDSQYLNGE